MIIFLLIVVAVELYVISNQIAHLRDLLQLWHSKKEMEDSPTMIDEFDI